MLTEKQLKSLSDSLLSTVKDLYPSSSDDVATFRRNSALAALPLIVAAIQEYDRLSSEGNPPSSS